MLNRKKELEQHYRETVYSVCIENKQFDIKIEKPLPTIIQELVNKEKSAVILTAWNPRSQIASAEENKYRNEKLHSALNNYTIFKALGHGSDLSWPAEDSFFILGISRKEIEELAIEYDQYAYVWCESGKPASLIFTHIWQSL